MRVFIDTNIYLNFFKTSAEKVNSLEILRSNLKEKNINLIFPHVTQNEFFKNLPKTKFEYVETIRAIKFSEPQYAVVARNKAQGGAIDKIVKDLETEKEKIIREYLDSSKKIVDHDIQYLMDNAVNIHEDINLIEKANRRRLLGFPPGKDKMEHHLGDEVVWEMLLAKCNDDDLTIIAADSDWRERNIEQEPQEKIKDFLLKEWRAVSSKELKLYTTLGEYINKNLKLRKKIPEESIKEEQVLGKQSFVTIPGSGFTINPGYSTGGFIKAGKAINGVTPAVTVAGQPIRYGDGISIYDTSAIQFPHICVGCGAVFPSTYLYCYDCGLAT
jgi:hypothetical protein